MTIDASTQAAVLAGGAAVLVVVGGALFKAATLRGNATTQWTRRVDFAVAALDEKAISGLERLRDDVDAMLPSPDDAAFDPAQVIADPAPLSNLAAETASYYANRTRMKADLERLRRLGRVFVLGLAALFVATLAITLYYGDIAAWTTIRLLGYATLAVAAVTLVPAGVFYAVLQDRLASAEIRAGTGGRVLEGET